MLLSLCFIGMVTKMSKRRLISFESDIIDDVYKKLGGKYTKEQISDVFTSSVAYINNICRFTDCMSVVIPWVGEVICNRKDMDRYIGKLKYEEERLGVLGESYRKERRLVFDKLDQLSTVAKEKGFRPGDYHNKDLAESFRYFQGKDGFEALQDYQNEVFFEKE